ncbi:MAG TPA: GNAT family N-acetyltransferase, partial [Caulobacteraceae bacterium]|nr:GNAT family N-acetyltransferase [Caulobacteraceae bacterium]
MDHAEVLVRAVELEDMPAIAEVLNQPRAVWGTLQVPYTSVGARQKRHAANSAGQTLLAAVIEGKVVGTAGLHPVENRRRAHAASIGMAVHDAYAGRGAGRALLTALLEQADRWLNFKRVELTVWADNQRAIALTNDLASSARVACAPTLGETGLTSMLSRWRGSVSRAARRRSRRISCPESGGGVSRPGSPHHHRSSPVLKYGGEGRG